MNTSPIAKASTRPDPETLRERCGRRLSEAGPALNRLKVFAGFDGFVDRIIHVVDQRENAERFSRLPTIERFASRAAAAAGKSTNFELVQQQIKLGGNGPILANALATFGARLTYVGALGWPSAHPVFAPFTERAQVHSVADPGLTDALEFEDGKLILSKCDHLRDVNWPNLEARFGRERLAEAFASSELVAFVNWTMLPAMSDIWETLQRELMPQLSGPPRRLFLDLADPEKRRREDIRRALELMVRFRGPFNVTLGLNEKEAGELAKVLELPPRPRTEEGLAELAQALHEKIGVDTLVIHPVRYALTASPSGVEVVQGPFVPNPKITTGAGDHFNAGFCLGQMLGFSDAESLLMGVTTSGHYVRTAQSPTHQDLLAMWKQWPGAGSAAVSRP
ncbi:MAG: carbohydrate kinase family protein [Verrucomicrobia bacterium]|nr:carbohydrate kinase family protein [Verrucomicrobiota bacterium]